MKWFLFATVVSGLIWLGLGCSGSPDAELKEQIEGRWVWGKSPISVDFETGGVMRLGAKTFSWEVKEGSFLIDGKPVKIHKITSTEFVYGNKEPYVHLNR